MFSLADYLAKSGEVDEYDVNVVDQILHLGSFKKLTQVVRKDKKRRGTGDDDVGEDNPTPRETSPIEATKKSKKRKHANTETKTKTKIQIGTAIYTDDSSVTGTSYEPSEDHVDDDSTLPSDMESTEPDSLEEELRDDVGMYQKTLYDYHKEAFYKAYTPYFNNVSNMHLITEDKYNEVKQALPQPKQPKEAQLIRKWRTKYSVGNNIAGCCLYRDGLVVVTFEEVFDIIREAHTKISHARMPRRTKKSLMSSLDTMGSKVLCSVLHRYLPSGKCINSD